MVSRLPNEIIYHISNLVGEESTFDLKPLVLVNRQWNSTTAPALLKVISISSLGGLVELCDQVVEYHGLGNSLRSSVAKYTKTIIIPGITYADADSHVALEDLDKQPRGPGEGDDEAAIRPDIEIKPDKIRQKIRTAFSQFILLDGFEWYGRFAGDHHLVRYLQQATVIRHLAYGTNMLMSSRSLAYRANAFTFEGLETLAITTEYQPRSELFYAIAQMMHHNPKLRSILFDCNYISSMSGYWSLVGFICDTSLDEKRGDLWQSTEEVEMLAKFLVAHPKIETLILQETSIEGLESETSNPPSLAGYPDALPVLKRLFASPRLIAGVLESRAACLSVQKVIDNSGQGFHSEGVKAPYVDRIMDALECVANNRIKGLRLEVPQLSHEFYARIARIAPKIYFLELLRPLGIDSTAPNDSDFDPIVDIPSCLNKFPSLEIIGGHIVEHFVKALGIQGYDAYTQGVMKLARQVPRIKAIHTSEGKLIPISRDMNGGTSVADPLRFLDNRDYDWMTFGM
ncbi:unnamed protein product [Rhizoctonia solani]|uniref:Uncharacterized protein n=1 Tax=Rhizoctonia solani TaxID=456999 RepID=A0A8H2WIW9_9AGAM|nr:unnamed protein product [Rhizoctonia solani]